LNAVLVSLAVTILLSLINIGSTVALFAIVSLTITSLMTSYMITIGCLIIKRLRGQPLPPHRWSLGKYGLAINIGALVFVLPLFIFAMFPVTAEVELETMNWSSVMYSGVITLATVYYFLLGGRDNYIPPVALVKRDL
jgi:amino acid transporter